MQALQRHELHVSGDFFNKNRRREEAQQRPTTCILDAEPNINMVTHQFWF